MTDKQRSVPMDNQDVLWIIQYISIDYPDQGAGEPLCDSPNIDKLVASTLDANL